MKKFALVLTSAACALCAAFGVMAMNSVEVSADVATVELSATKVMKSTNNDKMLLATAVTGYESVYEVGYTFTGEVETIYAETNKYYSEIVTGSKTWTAEDIFGEDYAEAGIIVWEIEYDPMADYTFQAYAKYGEVTNEGIVMGDPETVATAAERTVETSWVAATSAEGADAFAVLKNTSNWGRFYHGYPYLTDSNETSVWTNAISGNGSDKVGFTWTKTAINDIIALGFKKISFTITSDTNKYAAIYFAGDCADWIIGNYTKVNETYYFASGSTVTIDLVKVMENIGADTDAPTAAIKFAFTTGTSWAGDGVQTKVTFTNIAFEKMSQAELDAQKATLAFEVMKGSSFFGSYYHGQSYLPGYDENSVWTNACQANSPQVGFCWNIAEINKIVALGFSKITFTVTAVDSDQYVVIYFNDSKKGGIEGEYVNHPTYDYMYYFENGSQVTVDLGELSARGVNLNFALTPDVSWSVTTAAQKKVTFTNISFEKFTEEELAQKAAFEALKSAFIAQYHGYATGVGSDGNSIWATANAGGNSAFAGFGFSKDAINAIIALGFKTMTFTVTTSADAHVDIWGRGMSTADNHISGDIVAIDANEYYFASGTQVTIDLVKIIEKVASLDVYPDVAIELCVTDGATWKAASSQVVTFSNISFGK